MITVEEARALIFRDASPGPVESTSLLRALGKVLAEPVSAPCALPPCDVAAHDGFAVRTRDLEGAAPGFPARLPIPVEELALCSPLVALGPGNAMRLMEGQALPRGADAVVRIEEAREESGHVSIFRSVSPGENIRGAGADFRQGERMLEPGTVLTAACIALLAGAGLMEVNVHAAPRVAILTAGEEHFMAGPVTPGSVMGAGLLPDSNAFALAAMVSEAGGIPILMGGLQADPEATLRQLREASTHDVVVISGAWGKDAPLADLLERHGEVHFDRVAQQPGKPFTYATFWEKPVFAFPGHADSNLVCFELYVRPLLRLMTGQRDVERPRLWVTMAEAFANQSGKQTYLRVILDRTSDGATARLAGSQDAAKPRAVARANGLVIVPADVIALAVGERVEALALETLN